jgi:hypothetical protein
VELAKITLRFLSGQADVLEKILKDGFQTSSTDGGRIIDLPPSSRNARGVIEGSEEWKEAAWKCDKEKALVSVGALLNYKAGVFKVASARAGIYHRKETTVAQSLLEKVGLMRFVLYKLSGVGGLAARYAVKRPLPGEQHVAASMAVLNLVKMLFKVSPSVYKQFGTDIPLPESLTYFSPRSEKKLEELSKPWVALLTCPRNENLGVYPKMPDTLADDVATGGLESAPEQLGADAAAVGGDSAEGQAVETLKD